MKLDGIRESPQLIAVLKEMKEGLDTVTNKIQALTAKVRVSSLIFYLWGW